MRLNLESNKCQAKGCHNMAESGGYPRLCFKCKMILRGVGGMIL
jgi:hypothetical protein